VTSKPTFVVVGANLTGGAAVTTLRAEGFDGRVILIGAEREPPYERPPLSKDYLRGEIDRDSFMLRAASWYEENDIELRLDSIVARIDPRSGQVVLDGGERLPYDRVLVATGGRNRRLGVPGHDLKGIHELRTIADADALRAEASARGRAVVIGAGFIGCEVAASLRQLGVEVEVIEVLEAPMLRGVGPEVGRLFEEIHRDHGVAFRFRQAVKRFEGTGGRVEAVITDQGARLGCDFVVVGVGIEPATALVEETGVTVENGIIVDQFCRTSVAGVFAAGDVANHYHPLFDRRVRVEHWDNALKQGEAAAENMMGIEVAFDDPHWFWSDQYDQNLQYVGNASEWDDFVVRGKMSERDFVGFYCKGGVVLAAVGLNRGKDVRRSADFIRSRRPVDPGALRDEDVDLKKLAAELATQEA